MKTQIKTAILGLCLIGSTQAQVVLQNFSTTADAVNNYFYGTWEASGDTNGTLSPNANFIQGAGVYSIQGSTGIIPTDSASSLVEFFNSSPVSVAGNSFISVTAQTLAGNVASSFSILLKDTNGFIASAGFATGLFPTGSYTTQIVALSPIGAFNPLAIDSVIISGNQPGGTAAFAVSFDNISAVAAATAIPEPSTYAMIFGVFVLGMVAYRRRAVRVAA